MRLHPSLGTSLAKVGFFICEGIVSNLICYFIYYLFLFFYSQPRQTTQNAKKATRNKMT